MPRPLTTLPTPRFKVRKKPGVDLWYVIHYNNDHLRWEAYEDTSRSRVPIARKYDDYGKAQARAQALDNRHPWTDFDRQLFEHRTAGDWDWPLVPGEARQIADAVQARQARP